MFDRIRGVPGGRTFLACGTAVAEMATGGKSKSKAKASVSGPVPTLAEYVEAFCDAPLTRKAVINLSSMLAQVMGQQLGELLPDDEIVVGHRSFGGSVRGHHLDAWISSEHHGLQLGVDVKGLNSASSVGKNWNNRIDDLHGLGTNHHGKFPHAVMGGLLAIPFEGISDEVHRKIAASIAQLNGRRVTGNSQNMLEVASLMVISKEKRMILPDHPKADSPLRVEKFASTMAEVFNSRRRP